MSKEEWIAWVTLLQVAETLPQDEDEFEIANGPSLHFVKGSEVEWEPADLN